MILKNMNCWEFIDGLPDQSVDVIIADPPYNGEVVNMDELRRVCRGHIVSFCAPFAPFFEPDELAYWVKPTSTKNYSKHLGNFVEWILVERHGAVFNAGLHWSNYTGVYTDILLKKPDHPFEKPLSLIQRLVAIYSSPGDIVFDPFMGSGTTKRASLPLGRDFYGCEIDPKYFDLCLA